MNREIVMIRSIVRATRTRSSLSRRAKGPGEAATAAAAAAATTSSSWTSTPPNSMMMIATRPFFTSCIRAAGKSVGSAESSAAAAAAATESEGTAAEEVVNNDNAHRRQHQQRRERRERVVAFPKSPWKGVPAGIARPPYAATGVVPYSPSTDRVALHDAEMIDRMRNAARLARRCLDLACSLAAPGVTTDAIDTAVHEAIIANGAYPSPLNYAGFPKSLCSSINEVICHGIPDTRPLRTGDVVSFDVSCFLDGVHGDNCATVIVGDVREEEEKAGAKKKTSNNNNKKKKKKKGAVAGAEGATCGGGGGVDWRGVPYKHRFESAAEREHFVEARRLVRATRESLYAAIDECRPGGCLTSVGSAIADVADAHGYESVEKYRGHGIGTEFHTAPFVKHYRNDDRLTLLPGMIFTIEPMLAEHSSACFEWDDAWTVATADGGLAAQFEHTVLITPSGVEILTLPE